MPNRQLTSAELEHANAVLDAVRAQLKIIAGEDEDLYWALRRKVCKELGYDERGKPSHRKALKFKKWKRQKAQCAKCASDLPERGAVLDRIVAMNGYTDENTRLLCPECDAKEQEASGFA